MSAEMGARAEPGVSTQRAEPTLEQQAATLSEHVELVGRRGDLAVWWCPSWSGVARQTADAHGDAFHVVLRQGQAAPRWWCDCASGASHPKGDAACPHVRACQLWIERRAARRGS